ncbi:MAG: DUF5615 family PIN-like protein, partial [Pirellula sp.]
MKLSLEENLGTRGADELRKAGHDVATVAEQQMTSATDQELIVCCHSEHRCLVTLDLDFSNPFVFSPRDYSKLVEDPNGLGGRLAFVSNHSMA